MNIEEVKEEDFMKIGGEQPPHIKIEQALSQLGGGGVNGNTFKQQALKAAGWKYDQMRPYASRANEACEAFNLIRKHIGNCASAEDLISALSGE